MPRKQKSPTITQSIILDKNRCRLTTIDGRRCRMYRAKGHKSLCMTHAQQEEQMLNAETVAAELIGPVHEYQTALCVNRTLGCLFNLIAQKRISNKDGALLAYVGQMLLQSVGSTIKEELLRVSNEERGTTEWEANVLTACEILSNDYSLRDKAAAENESEDESETEASPEESPAPAPQTVEPSTPEPQTTEPAAEQPEGKPEEASPEEASDDEPKDEEPDTMIDIETDATEALVRSLDPRR
jgi:hypothetical protein